MLRDQLEQFTGAVLSNPNVRRRISPIPLSCAILSRWPANDRTSLALSCFFSSLLFGDFNRPLRH